MRLTAMVAIAMGIGISAQAAEAPRAVILYLRDSASVPVDVKGKAEIMATKMFAEIGVQIDWHTGVPRRSSADRPLAIELVTDTPTELMPGALAYALPYEGVSISVFYDRIQRTQAPIEVLAHVLVHEITHILEGTNCHSDGGIMKAHWTATEIAGMQRAPLPFTQQDIDLIHAGLQARSSGPRALLAANRTAAAVEAPVK